MQDITSEIVLNGGATRDKGDLSCIICQALASQIGRSCDVLKLCSVVAHRYE